MAPIRLLQILSALIVALGMVPDARAMYCGNRLVSEGDSRAKVLALCGSPVDAQSRVVYLSSTYGFTWPHYRQRSIARARYGRHRGAVWQQEAVVPVTVEEWTFDRGSNRLMRLVTFENGRVTRIRTLGYGFQRPHARAALPR